MMRSRDRFLPVKISVPAKIMLVGEYAVMEGYHSLSLALDKKLEVTVVESTENFSKITSSLWEFPFCFTEISELKSYDNILTQAVGQALKNINLPCFFNLSITSNFSVSSGFGSSSALRLAVISALRSFFAKQELPQEKHWSLAEEAYLLQKGYQGRASGYDVLTQKVGGIVSFKNPEKNWPGIWEKLDWNMSLLEKNLHIYTGGKGAPTKEAITKTDLWLVKNKLKEKFFQSSEKLYKSLCSFFTEANEGCYEKVIQGVAEHRKILLGSPDFPQHIETFLSKIPGFDQTWSYKTTGSGGEDALLFFGDDRALVRVSEVMAKESWVKENWGLDCRGSRFYANKEEEDYENKGVCSKSSQ